MFNLKEFNNAFNALSSLSLDNLQENAEGSSQRSSGPVAVPEPAPVAPKPAPEVKKQAPQKDDEWDWNDDSKPKPRRQSRDSQRLRDFVDQARALLTPLELESASGGDELDELVGKLSKLAQLHMQRSVETGAAEVSAVKGLQTKIEQLKSSLKSRDQELKMARDHAAAAEAKVAQTLEGLQGESEQLTAAQKKLEASARELQHVRSEVHAQQERANASSAQLQEAQKLNEARVAQMQAEVDEKEAQHKISAERLQESSKALSEAQEQLRVLRTTLEQYQREEGPKEENASLRAQVATLQKELAVLRESDKEQRSAIGSLSSDLQEKELAMAELVKQVEEASLSSQSERSESEESHDGTKEQASILQSQMESLSQELACARSVDEEKTAVISTLRMDVAQRDAALAELQKELQAAQQQSGEALSEAGLDSHTTQEELYKEQSEELKKIKEQNEELLANHGRLLEEHEKLKEDLAQMRATERDHSESPNENAGLVDATTEELRMHLADIEATANQREQLLAAAEEQLVIQRKRVEELEKCNGNLSSENEQWQSELQRTSEASRELKVQLQAHVEAYEQASSDVKQLRAAVNDGEQKLSESRYRIAEGSKELASKNEAITELERQLQMLSGVHEEHGALKHSFENLEKTLQERERALGASVSELEALKESYKVHTQSQSALAEQFTDEKQKSREKEKILEMLQSRVRQLDRELTEMGQEQTAARKRIGELTVEVESKTRRCQELDASQEEIQMKVTELERSLDDQISQRAELDKEFQEAKAALRDHDEDVAKEQKRADTLGDDLQKITAEKQQLDRELFGANKSLAELTKQITEEKEQFAAYKKRVKTTLKKLNARETELQEMLNASKVDRDRTATLEDEQARQETLLEERTAELEDAQKQLIVSANQEAVLERKAATLVSELNAVQSRMEKERERFSVELAAKDREILEHIKNASTMSMAMSAMQDSVASSRGNTTQSSDFHQGEATPRGKAGFGEQSSDSRSEDLVDAEDYVVLEVTSKVQSEPEIAGRFSSEAEANRSEGDNEARYAAQDEVPENFSPSKTQAPAGPKLIYVSELELKVQKSKEDCFRLEAVIQELKAEITMINRRCKESEQYAAELRHRLERGATLGGSGHEAIINMEYLKNIVLRYLLSGSVEEKKRLAPVVGQILKFTAAETDTVLRKLEQSVKPGAVARNILGGIFQQT